MGGGESGAAFGESARLADETSGLGQARSDANSVLSSRYGGFDVVRRISGMIPADITYLIHDFGRVRIAMVQRPLPGGFAVVNTQVLSDPSERPDWPRLIAGISGALEPDIPEAS